MKNTTTRNVWLVLMCWFPPLCEMSLVYYFSTIPLCFSYIPYYQDEVLHVLAYSLLATLWCWVGHHCWPYLAMLIRYSSSIAITTGFGIIVEIRQTYCGRCFEWGDILANLLGAMIGTFLYHLCMSAISKRK